MHLGTKINIFKALFGYEELFKLLNFKYSVTHFGSDFFVIHLGNISQLTNFDSISTSRFSCAAYQTVHPDKKINIF